MNLPEEIYSSMEKAREMAEKIVKNNILSTTQEGGVAATSAMMLIAILDLRERIAELETRIKERSADSLR